MMLDDLVTFLRARLDDSERLAEEFDWAMACRDPVAAKRFYLADIDAKRRIITAIHDRKTWRSDPPAEFIDLDIEARVLELLALPYAAHPDYDERWKP